MVESQSTIERRINKDLVGNLKPKKINGKVSGMGENLLYHKAFTKVSVAFAANSHHLALDTDQERHSMVQALCQADIQGRLMPCHSQALF